MNKDNISKHINKIILRSKKLCKKIHKAISLSSPFLRKTYDKRSVQKIIGFAKKHNYISFVIIPTFILAAYYILLATPRYESTAIISLKQNNTAPTINSSLTSLVGGGSQTVSDSYLLIDYISSFQMLNSLQKEIKLKSMYNSSNIDFFSRLSRNADDLKFLKYYNKMVSLNYDIQSNAITINVQGYTPKQAQETLSGIVKNSQNTIDRISQTLAKNRMVSSKEKLNEIKIKALKSQDKLVNFQSKKGVVDPESSMSSKTTIIGELKSRLTAEETKLTSLESYLNPQAAEIIATKQKIIALKTQITKEKKEFLEANPENGNKSELDDLVSNFQLLKLNAEFTMTEYHSALQSYETAKLDSESQQSYLVDVVKPTLPDTPKHPLILYNLITLFVILSALYGLARMIIIIILENR